jgi:tetratricopeptide (TPR) repeat protein
VRVGAHEGPRALDEAHLGLAMIASRKGDWPTARAEFADLVKANDRDATSQLNLAKACLELKDVPCAVEHGEAAHKARDKDETILFALGTIYLAASRVDDAEKAFQGITALTPGAASAPYGLALVAAKRGDKDKALAELEEAVKLKLPNPDRIAKDPGLAPLKDDPRFIALTAKAAAAK